MKSEPGTYTRLWTVVLVWLTAVLLGSSTWTPSTEKV